MWFKHPNGGGNLSHAGVEYQVDHRGFLELPDFLMRTAHELGFEAVAQDALAASDELTPIEIAQMKRSDLMAYCVDHKVEGYSASMKSAELRDLIAKHIDDLEEAGKEKLAADQPTISETENPDPAKVADPSTLTTDQQAAIAHAADPDADAQAEATKAAELQAGADQSKVDPTVNETAKEGAGAAG